MVWGTALVILSAVLFGFTPVLGKISYAHGSNPIMLTLLRSFFAIPVLAIVMKLRRIPFAITKKEWISFLIVGAFGFTLTTVTLYSSYQYISVGTATTLHFLYPMFVMIVSAVIFRRAMPMKQKIVLVLSFVGIATFMDFGAQGSNMGVFLALVSAVSYSFLLIYLEKSVLNQIDGIKNAFYIAIVVVIVTAPLAVVMGDFTLALTPIGWYYSILVSLLASVVAVTCFQFGVKYVGAVSTAMLSLFEPITGIFVGVLILKEQVTLLNLFGCIIIFGAIILYIDSTRVKL